MRLDELCRIYCSLHAVAPVTEVGYLDTARRMCNVQLEELTLKVLTEERANSKSPFTWNSNLGKLRAIIKFAAKSGWCDSDHPVFKVKRLHAGLVVRKEITENDRSILIEVIDQSTQFAPKWFWVALFDVLYYSGIRRKQLCYLQWGDLNLKNATVLLRAAGAKNKRERLLPLHPKLVKSLQIYRKHFEKTLNGFPIDSSTQVFNWGAVHGERPYKTGELRPDMVTRFFYLLSEESNIHITAHLLRHSFATKISREIPNIKMVQLLLNHDRVETTMRYIHPTLQDMRNIMSLPLLNSPTKPTKQR